MVAVVHEVAGAQTFNDGWWKGDLYFDEEKAFYKALGGGNLQWRSPVRLIMPTGIKTLAKSFLHVCFAKVLLRTSLCCLMLHFKGGKRQSERRGPHYGWTLHPSQWRSRCGIRVS
jgi:hypothetical protein